MYFCIAFSTITSLFFSFIFTRNWFENNYPVEYETIKHLFYWYALKTYIKFDMVFNNMKRIFYNFNKNKNKELIIHFILDGKDQGSNVDEISEYDFIYYRLDTVCKNLDITDTDDYAEENKYMVFTSNISGELENVEKSNVRFLSPHIHMDDTDIQIIFKENIYLVDNELFNRNFIKWYLLTNQNKVLADEDVYTVKFFDNKMDFVELKSDQGIILKKDTYVIVADNN